MKSALASALFVGVLALGACAHTDQAATPAPSALSSAQIEAELAAISAEMNALYQGRSYPVGAPAEPAPLRVSALDSNGVPLEAHKPDVSPYQPGAFASSRPWGYARLQDLTQRYAALSAELGKRTSSLR